MIAQRVVGAGEFLAMLAIMTPLVGFGLAIMLIVAVLRMWHHVAAIRRSLDRLAAGQPAASPPESKPGGW